MKKGILIFIILFLVIFCSKKSQQAQAQNRPHRTHVNVYVGNPYYFPPPVRQVVYITYQYSVYWTTVYTGYSIDMYGYQIRHGYNVFRNYTCFSNGVTTFVDTFTYF